MQFHKFFLYLFLISSFVPFANADDNAYLDPPRASHAHPAIRTNTDGPMPLEFGRSARTFSTQDIIATQTAVKAQGSRGTCSIFSAVALLESLLVANYGLSPELDLSEEWLEYTLMYYRTSDGSFSSTNFLKLASVGVPREASLPYIGEDWTKEPMFGLAQERCGRFNGTHLTSCLLGHRDPELIKKSDSELLNRSSQFYDPEFQAARREAARFRDQFIHLSNEPMQVGYIDEIKSRLNSGQPLTLDIDFYYGAWNHRKAPDIGIERNMRHWGQGIVGYPERGSIDLARSHESPAGHSVVIVGYDDNRVVQVRVPMSDGSTREFSYRGVYYFKNSWGTDGFGANFQLQGSSYPGYGMITQKYAHEYGTFTQMPLLMRN
jgi:hypothetical protein